MIGLAALALLAVQPAEPDGYRAIGASPFWQVTIRSDFTSFLTPAREMLVVETAPRQETAHGFTHQRDDLSIAVEHGDCRDSITGSTYPDRVTVRSAGTVYQGCGGTPRGGNIRADYGASGSEPFWGLEIAAGRLTFDNDGQVVIARMPRPVVSGNNRRRRYTAPGISVLLKREDCEMEDERTYADTVTVIVLGRTFEGCGGRVIREAPED